MAVPAFVAKNDNTAGGNTGTVAIPAGASTGDRLLLVLSIKTQSPTGVPTGWTLIQNSGATPTAGGGKIYVYTATATSGGSTDPGASTVITFTGNANHTIACLAYAASDVLNSAIDVSDTGSQATLTTPTASAFSDARVVHIYGPISNGNPPAAQPITWTPHASTTERVDNGGTVGTSGSGRQSALMVADESMAVAGTSTARTATPSEAVQGAPVVVLIGSAVSQPTADAGLNQTVALGATVNLDGAASGGAGAPFTYQWTQTSGTAVTLSDDTAENPSFTAPSSGATLVFQLVVTDDGDVPSLPDTVTVTVLDATNTAVPVTDLTTSGWSKQPAGAATVADTMGDSTDATYAYYEDPVGTVVLEVGLSGLTAPGAGQPVTVWYRPSIFEATSGTVTVILKQGASTVIATFSANNWSTVDTVQQFSHELTSGQVAAITDWNDLRLRFEGAVS